MRSIKKTKVSQDQGKNVDAIKWPVYNSTHKLYLDINLKWQVRSHFNSLESSLIVALPQLLTRYENDWHRQQATRRNQKSSHLNNPLNLLGKKNGHINGSIVAFNHLNDDEEGSSRVSSFKKFSLKFTDNVQSNLKDAGVSRSTGLHNNASLSLAFNPSVNANALNDSSSAKTTILLSPEQPELSSALSMAVLIGLTLFLLNLALLAGVYCKVHMTRVRRERRCHHHNQLNCTPDKHPHMNTSSFHLDTCDTSMVNGNSLNTISNIKGDCENVPSDISGGASLTMTQLTTDVASMTNQSTGETAGTLLLACGDGHDESYLVPTNAYCDRVDSSNLATPAAGETVGEAVSFCFSSAVSGPVTGKRNSRRSKSNRRVELVRNCDYASQYSGADQRASQVHGCIDCPDACSNELVQCSLENMTSAPSSPYIVSNECNQVTSIMADYSNNSSVSTGHHHVRFSPVICTSDYSPESSMVSCSSTPQLEAAHPGNNVYNVSTSLLKSSSSASSPVTMTYVNSSSSNIKCISNNSSGSGSGSGNGSGNGSSSSSSSRYYRSSYAHNHRTHQSAYKEHDLKGNNSCYPSNLLPRRSSDEVDVNCSTGKTTISGQRVEAAGSKSAAINLANDQNSDTSSSGVSSMVIVTGQSDNVVSSFMHVVPYDSDSEHNCFTSITERDAFSTTTAGNSRGNKSNNNSSSGSSSIHNIVNDSSSQSAVGDSINTRDCYPRKHAGDTSESILKQRVTCDERDNCIINGYRVNTSSGVSNDCHHLYSMNSVSSSSGGSGDGTNGCGRSTDLTSDQLMHVNHCHLMSLDAGGVVLRAVHPITPADGKSGQVYTITGDTDEAMIALNVPPSHLLNCQISSESAEIDRCDLALSYHRLNSPSCLQSIDCSSSLYTQSTTSSSSYSACSSSPSSSSSSRFNCTECNTVSTFSLPTSQSAIVTNSTSVNENTAFASSASNTSGYKGTNLYSPLNGTHLHFSTCDTATNGLGVIHEIPDEAHI